MYKLVKLARKVEPVPPHAVSRVGGEPIGMTKDTWPMFEGKPMAHLITLRREEIATTLPDSVAAIALFISSIMNNEAWSSSTKETAVRLLTTADLKRGTTTAQHVFGSPLDESLPAAAEIATQIVEYDFASVRRDHREADRQKPEGQLSEDAIADAMGEFIDAQMKTEIAGGKVGGLSCQQNLVRSSWDEQEVPNGHRVLFFFDATLAGEVNFGDMESMHVSANASFTEFAAWHH